MGIQSTVTITRSNAINRIDTINELVVSKNYLGLETESFEPDSSLEDWVNDNFTFASGCGDLENYTNRMLEDIMDRAFYRQSMFDNYSVIEDDE